MTKVIITGCSGKMGASLINAAASREDIDPEAFEKYYREGIYNIAKTVFSLNEFEDDS